MSVESYILRLQKEKAPGVGGTLILGMLSALETLYRRGVISRRQKEMAGAETVSIPVISVGNMTAGGTGKTPCIIRLTGMLKQSGHRPAVLTRGYRGKLEKNGGIVSDWDQVLLPAEEAGDEPYMMAVKMPHVPVLVGKDRNASAEKAIAMGADVLLLDDGFQYWRLNRDLDIVLIDCTNPFGAGHLLPRGLLREPLDCMKRADVFVLTKSDQVTEKEKQQIIRKIREIHPKAPVVESHHTPAGIIEYHAWKRKEEVSAEEGRGRKAFLLCGIGNPDSFNRTAEELGITVTGTMYFPDHHRYTVDDIRVAERRARETGAEILLTTEKDIVKIKEASEIPLYALKIKMKFTGDGEQCMNELISRVFGV